jgi:hypothetical protein
MWRWLAVLALAGCDMVLGLEERDPGPGPGNEDGDTARDDEDNCPGIRNDQSANMDGDGVGDACDPDPSVPGDRVVAFYGFDVPDDVRWEARNGVWTVAGGQLAMTSSGGGVQSYFTRHAPPLTPPYTVETYFTIDALVPYAGFGLTANLDVEARGVACSLLDHTEAPDVVQAYWGDANTRDIAEVDAGQSYRATVVVGTNEIRCEIQGTTAGQGGSVLHAFDMPRAGYIGFDATGDVTLRFDYLVVYGKD